MIPLSVKVTGLYVFPVKSLRGIPIDKGQLTLTGLKWDRYWMIVKPDGGFITQRQFPQMVLIQTKLTDDSLILSKVGMDDLVIPFIRQIDSNSNFTAKIWKDNCQVNDEGKAASDWLTNAIGAPKPLRLVRMANKHKRPQSRPSLLGDTTHTLFSDAAPYLVCNTASLQAINHSLKENDIKPVTIENFRPNIVIEGVNAFAEHQIKGLMHANYKLKLCYPCQRCAIPTIDILSGTRNARQQPFSLLAELNSMPDNEKAPAFGENGILESGENTSIRIGDQLILEK